MADRVQTACVVMRSAPERDVVRRLLKKLSLTTSAAEHPYEAMSQLGVNRPDLVVLSLEGLTSKDIGFLEQLRRSAPSVRVLVLVPEGRRSDALAFLEAGADSILPQASLVPELGLLVKALLRPEATDPLTGLPNRPAFEKALPIEISRAVRQGTTLAVALMDIDNFGDVNADLGYRKANEVLLDVSSRLALEFRNYDLLARWGGDEFIANVGALPKDKKKARDLACHVLKRAREAVQEGPVLLVCGEQRKVTMKGGFALFPHDVPEFQRAATKHLTPEECEQAGRALFDIANKALNEASRRGRNQIVCAACMDGECPISPPPPAPPSDD